MRTQYGDVYQFYPPLQYDRWYAIELYCQLNTPGKEGEGGQNNGILKAWIDGEPAFEKTNIRFRDLDSLKIETIWVNVYHEGRTPAPQDLHLYLDQMTIACQPIGLSNERREPDATQKLPRDHAGCGFRESFSCLRARERSARSRQL